MWPRPSTTTALKVIKCTTSVDHSLENIAKVFKCIRISYDQNQMRKLKKNEFSL